MFSYRFCATACLLLTLASSGARQAIARSDSAESAKEPIALKDQTNSSNSTFVLGIGDQFVVRALHVAELADKTFRVGPDGNVTFPMIGELKAADVQITALEAAIVAKLKKFYVMPDVTIMVTDYRSQPVSIIGAVVSPGVHQLEGQKTLLQMLSSAGGTRPDAGPIIRITRTSRWGAIPLPGAHQDATGENSLAQINLRDLLSESDSSMNIQIFPNDVISIPVGGAVYVVGQVKKAGSFPLGSRQSLSILEALSMAEGLDIKAAAGKAIILRPLKPGQSEREHVPVNLAKVLKGQDPDIPLGPSDVLFVPSSAARSATLKSIDTAIQIGTGLAIFR